MPSRFATTMLALLLAAGGAAAQPAEQFYAAKPQMRIIVSSTAGGGYDFFGRLMSRYMAKYLPGNPTIVVQNMPGGGGLTAANYLYNVAPKDGTTFAIIDRGVPTAAVLYGEDSKSQFDGQKFVWLGSLAKEIGVGIVSVKAPAHTIAELKVKEVTLGSNGLETDSAMFARLVNTLVGTRIKVVVGYPGQTEYLLAMTRGETDGLFMSGWSGPNSLIAKKAYAAGEIRYFVQMTRSRHPDFGDTPTIFELVPSAEDRQVVDMLLSRLELGRPFIAPPGIAEDRVALLRKAFRAAADDPELRAEAPKGGNSVEPIYGEEAEAMIKLVYALPEPVKKRIQEIVRIPK